MKHKMKLRFQPFNMIRSGQKTYELRLYDEKRQRVQVNDEIEFSCLDGNETPFVVRVIALHLFKNFGELYATLPLLECGYTKETIDTASPEDMNQYYSVEEQARYGVVGIEIKLIQSDDPMLRASRFLSLVLRHKPEAAGVTLDEHGWADVEALLQGVSKRHPLTMEQLEEIVRTDDKQRYSFNIVKAIPEFCALGWLLLCAARFDAYKGVMPISTITKTWSEDKSDGVFNANDICKIVDGVAIPYKTKRR